MTNIDRYILRTPRLVSVAATAFTVGVGCIVIAPWTLSLRDPLGFIVAMGWVGLVVIGMPWIHKKMVMQRWQIFWRAKFSSEEEAFVWCKKASPEILNYVVGIYFGHYGDKVPYHNEA